MIRFNTAKPFIWSSLFLLFFIVGTKLSFSQQVTKVTIQGLKSDKGNVRLAVFDKDKEFLDMRKYVGLYKLTIKNKKAFLEIKNMKKGNYALAILHDENANEVFDKNWLGIPKEGFGFSNNPRVLVKAPSFQECVFDIGNENKLLTITMKYF